MIKKRGGRNQTSKEVMNEIKFIAVIKIVDDNSTAKIDVTEWG